MSSIYEQWLNKAFSKDGRSVDAVWDVYLPAEQKVYEYILENKVTNLSGTVTELGERFNMSAEYVIAFVDGLNDILPKKYDVRKLDENSQINLDIDFEKLYKKMVEYRADHLYTLPQWNNIFDETKQKALFAEQRNSRTVVKGKKIGIPAEYFSKGLEKDVKDRVLEAAKKLESMGAIVEEFNMPEIDYAIPAYYIIACAEASSNLSRYDGVKYGFRTPEFEDLTDLYNKTRSDGFGMEVKRRIMIGAFVLSSGYYDAYYKKALKVKAVIKNAFDRAFEKYDAILSPAAPTTALKMGENLSDPLKMYLGDIYTVSVNLAGLPSIVIPCGFDKEGLPVGLQITGKAFSENNIMNIAYSFQQETDYHTKKPVLKVSKEA